MAKALLLLPLLAAADGIAADGIHEALDQDDTCSDPSCALGLLHVRGNATSEEVADYQPGRETGVSCMWSNCDTAKLGDVTCHHFRCICKDKAQWSEERKTCVEESASQVSQDTGGTCSWFGCSKSRGEVSCVKGRCLCNDGYVAFKGKCYKTTTTTAAPETTTGTWPDVVASFTTKPFVPPPPPPARHHDAPAPSPPKPPSEKSTAKWVTSSEVGNEGPLLEGDREASAVESACYSCLRHLRKTHASRRFCSFGCRSGSGIQEDGFGMICSLSLSLSLFLAVARCAVLPHTRMYTHTAHAVRLRTCIPVLCI
ncbi:unnamed protein product [Symbiodinium microadriaticum]|nr:unnamed protein product [Symbiodinium sp. KB8]CAE7899422.1 unnamed protein product [Symbiodinium microadriaticum]